MLKHPQSSSTKSLKWATRGKTQSALQARRGAAFVLVLLRGGNLAFEGFSLERHLGALHIMAIRSKDLRQTFLKMTK
jgi:hypothetical protein